MRLQAAFLSLAILLCSAVIARADSGGDVIFLNNGGRVVGKIMVEDPAKGITIQLADGSTRAFKPTEVKSIEYAPDSPAAVTAGAAPAPAPVAGGAVAPAPTAAPPPAVSTLPPPPPPTYSANATAPVPTYRRRTGLFVLGIVGMAGGAVLATSGALTLSSDSCTTYDYDFSDPYADCSDDNETVGTALVVIGGVLFAVGVPLFVLGLIKVPVNPPPGHSLNDSPREETRLALSALLLGKDGVGLQLRGSM